MFFTFGGELTWLYRRQGTRMLNGRPLDEKAFPSNHIIRFELKSHSAAWTSHRVGQRQAAKLTHQVAMSVRTIKYLQNKRNTVFYKCLYIKYLLLFSGQL